MSLPIVAPGAAAAALICFIFAWNEYFLANLLTAVVARTTPPFLGSFVDGRGQFLAILSAASTIAVLPVIVAGWLAQKRLVRGLAMGAVEVDARGRLPRSGRPGASRKSPDPSPGPARSWSASRRSASVAPTSTSSTASSRPRVTRSFPGTRPPAWWSRSARQVTELSPGDRVSVDPTLTCGECSYCAIGRSNLCENWNGSGVARTDGSTAELQLAPVRNVHRLPDGVDLALAAMIEPLSCAIRGYDLLPAGSASTISSTAPARWA